MNVNEAIIKSFIEQIKFYLEMYYKSILRYAFDDADFWYSRLYPLQESIRMALGKDGFVHLDDENKLYFLCDGEKTYLE